MTTAFETAKAIGDAVLFEGYLRYPYREPAAKNRMRRQFGVLMPPAFASPQAGEHADCRMECLLEPRSHAVLHLRLRFLQAQERVVYRRLDDGRHQQVPSLTVGHDEYTTWDEAIEREIDAVLPVAELTAQRSCIPFVVGGAERTEILGTAGKLVRRTCSVTGELRLSARVLGGPYGGLRLRADVVNTTEWYEPDPPCEEALRHAMLAVHLVLSVNAGRFVSLTDPPEWARPAAEGCENHRLWPVLLGADDAAVLAAPITLYDHPVVAPESVGELSDGTEIDEILTLRTLAFTAEDTRAADERARSLVGAMPPELLERLRRTIRYLRSVTGAEPAVPWWDLGADQSVSPETDEVVVAGVAVSAGSHVRLRPGTYRTDAQDMVLDGRTATVRAVLSDVDGNMHLAVTVDGDPAADLRHTHCRYRYFTPDEIEPLREGR